MTATTVGWLTAMGVGLAALLLLAIGARAIARRRGAASRRDGSPTEAGGRACERDTGAAAAVERPEGGWSLDLGDDP